MAHESTTANSSTIVLNSEYAPNVALFNIVCVLDLRWCEWVSDCNYDWHASVELSCTGSHLVLSPWLYKFILYFGTIIWKNSTNNWGTLM